MFEHRDTTLWQTNPILTCDGLHAVNVMRSAGGLSSFGRYHCQDMSSSIWKLFLMMEWWI
jgi:hypothetical protein